jgi:signal transduction histidine kinase
MVGTQGDITSRKQMEERLRHSEEISIQVSRLAQIGAWEYTVAGKQLRWEPELFRISEVELGYEPSFLGMSKFIPGEAGEMFDQALELALNDGRSFDLECPFVTAQGRRRWVRVFGRTEFSDGQPVRIFGAVQEITARHEAEEAQRKMEGQLFQVQKMETLGTLAGGIAHDFNNLLTGIIGYQDLALDNLAEDHPSRPCLSEAHKACMRACELVEQILVFSRQTGGSERAAVDLGIMVEETRRFLRATVPATVKIEVIIAPNCGRVQADPSQLSQVLLNLGSNAAHAMRSGNGTLGIAVTPVTMTATQAASHGNLPAGQYVRLSVSDTGHGMNAETQKRIFDPFFTTKKAPAWVWRSCTASSALTAGRSRCKARQAAAPSSRSICRSPSRNGRRRSLRPRRRPGAMARSSASSTTNSWCCRPPASRWSGSATRRWRSIPRPNV